MIYEGSLFDNWSEKTQQSIVVGDQKGGMGWDRVSVAAKQKSPQSKNHLSECQYL